LIEPGKPWQNGVAESFNGKFRDKSFRRFEIGIVETRHHEGAST
jgi:transposase InsO family protein